MPLSDFLRTMAQRYTGILIRIKFELKKECVSTLINGAWADRNAENQCFIEAIKKFPIQVKNQKLRCAFT